MHEGHRKRMREKLLSGGKIPPHELLELLLTYSIPRKNTNDIAHRLLERFGSLSGVFHASEEELLSVRGVGEKTAALLRLLPTVCREMMNGSGDGELIDTKEKAVNYGRLLFRGMRFEALYALLLDSGMRLVDCVRLSGGSASGIAVNFRELISTGSAARCSAVILLHNHPGGTAVPSFEDRRFTDRAVELFSMMEIEVLEHIVMTDDGYITLMDTVEDPNQSQ